MSALPPSYLSHLIAYLSDVVKHRLSLYFSPNKSTNFADVPPNWSEIDHPLAIFIHENELSRDETLAFLLALAAHIKPDFYESILTESLTKPGDFPQLGGVRSQQSRVFLPTGETIVFLLAGDNLEKRIEIQQIFSGNHLFARKHILWLEDMPPGELSLSGKMVFNQEYIELFTTGRVSPPRFAMNFPAERIETKMEWEDLVLSDFTRRQIQELSVFLEHQHTVMHGWGMGKLLKPGYRVLFHGPPGTGKTLTAALIGKQTGRDVFRIDLSMVISKFIGETEKNLSNLFSKAENKDWILFFDEADALFGKRTNVRDAHDKYANQETAYLLQRIEGYNGLVILASNFKANIDDAFMRRFQSIIHFPMPGAAERLILWKKALPQNQVDLTQINLEAISQRHELSGASIINIVQYCCFKALERGDHLISNPDIREGIVREFHKEGKVVH